MTLPDNVQIIIQMLEDAGFEAYAVGGCVRDLLLGLTPYDYDIATDAVPAQMKEVFAGERIIATGEKYGTLTVVMGGIPYEITTYRADGEYSDGRRPDSVTFSSQLRDDLCRRDFTVNALAYSDKAGVIDHFGGQEDLRGGIIRAVGVPTERFTEDSLRILRALRFAAVYGFTIESETALAARKQRALLKNVSRERVMAELSKLICGFGVGDLISEYRDIFAEFVPNIADADLHRLNNAPADRITRLALLFAHLGKNKACNTLKRLKYSNATCKFTAPLISNYGLPPIEADRIVVKQMLSRYGEETFFRIANIREGSYEAAQIALDVIDKDECFTLRKMEFKGEVLVKLGFKGGIIGERLELLLQAHIRGECDNTVESMREYLKNRGLLTPAFVKRLPRRNERGSERK
ncbi:MAG: CCA tRNA nucleotidyltransferase [Oscillospiraceae bacterium]|nr:CCA tRNA nucleotidyltransferase [Oscillospiraceae bacterium]